MVVFHFFFFLGGGGEKKKFLYSQMSIFKAPLILCNLFATNAFFIRMLGLPLLMIFDYFKESGVSHRAGGIE